MGSIGSIGSATSDAILEDIRTGVAPGLDLESDAGQAGNVSAFGETLVAPLEPRFLAHFPYNANTNLVTDASTGSGSISHSGQFISSNSGAATSSSGVMRSTGVVEYFPGMGGLVRFTCIFDTGVAGNDQVIGIGNDSDGFFFGYNGTSFGVMRRSGGSDTWIPQSSWSEDTMDGTGPSGLTFDPSKGNVFQIKYQWLGFGAIRFYMENQTTGAFQLVHVISYANQNTVTTIENPTLPFCMSSTNTTNNTDISLKTASIGMYNEGATDYDQFPRYSVSNTKTLTTLLNILTIQNKSTYASITNQVRIQPDFLSMATDGTKNVEIQVYLNPTVGGTPSFTDIDTTNSVMAYDVAGTTISGGRVLGSFYLAKNDSLFIPLNEYNWLLAPGNELVFAAVSSASSDVSVSIGWKERFA